MRRLVVTLTVMLLILSCFPAQAAEPDTVPQMDALEALSLSSAMLFIENVGQFAPEARFQAWGGPGTAWLAEDALWITLVESSAVSRQLSAKSPLPESGEGEGQPRKVVNLRLSFVGADPHPRLEAFSRLEAKVSYFLGDAPEKWYPDVPVWGGVRYVDLYPGVDLLIGEDAGGKMQEGENLPRPESGEGRPSNGAIGGWGEGFHPLLWRLVVRDGAALQDVRLRIEGAEEVSLTSPQVEGSDAKGQEALQSSHIRLSTVLGTVVLPLPEIEGIETKGGEGLAVAKPQLQNPGPAVFEISTPFASAPSKGQASASLAGASDLIYSTFLGGNATEESQAIAVDGQGAAYLVGATPSTNFPTTTGAYDRTIAGTDVFVVKLNAAGSALVYATFLGGSSLDWGKGIAVDGSGNAYVCGETTSSNFPTTSAAYDRYWNGGFSDAFATKLNSTGSALIYSTYLGGSQGEGAYAVALDGSGNAYLTGLTGSSNFPFTAGAADTALNGPNDAFVVKLNSTGSGRIYATFLGGEQNDDGRGIAVDGLGAAYVTGSTSSFTGFPTTAGAFDESYNGDPADAFVVKLNPAGSAFAYGTYLGGSGNDLGSSIAVNGAGNAFVTGQTDWYGDFPTTLGAYDIDYNGGAFDAFVTKVNAEGSDLVYSTFLGGSDMDCGWGIAVDGMGRASVAGETDSSDGFPITSNPYDSSFNGGRDAFMTRLNLDGSDLAYSTFLGGTGNDVAYDIAVNGSGAAYVIGDTQSSGFPTTTGAYDRTYNSAGDAFASKLALPGGRVTFDTPGPWYSGFGYSAGGWTSQDKYPRFLADVNGDGLADVVGFASGGVYVSLSTGASFGAASRWIAAYGYSAGGWTSQDKYPRCLADVNGDGKADVVGFGNLGTYVSLSTGTSFGASTRWIATYGYSAGGWTSQDKYPRCLADVNGDGKADVVGFAASGVYVSLSTGTSFGASTRWIAAYGYSAGGWTSQNLYPRFAADVNGDGKADVVGFGAGGVYVSLSTGTNFSTPFLWIKGYGTSVGGWSSLNTYPRTLGDVNGDGQWDVVGFGVAGTYVSTSTGTIFRSPDLAIATYGTSTGAGSWTSQDKYPRWAADVNGDGKADIVGFGNAGPYVALSQ